VGSGGKKGGGVTNEDMSGGGASGGKRGVRGVAIRTGKATKGSVFVKVVKR